MQHHRISDGIGIILPQMICYESRNLSRFIRVRWSSHKYCKGMVTIIVLAHVPDKNDYRDPIVFEIPSYYP